MGNEILAISKIKLLDDEKNIKILVTTDDEGIPHPVVKESLHSDGDNIIYTEYLESSRTNRYLTRSLWFNKKVRILILTPEKKSYAVTALPVRAIVSGKIFQVHYEEVQRKTDFDLSTVWILKPLQIIDETLQQRMTEELESRPYFLHLDRIAKKEAQ
ncbi:MAG: hypothetical protein LBS82_03280 [Spirochaetaceae bacterium]|jgi:hypothetical protein|nr:hypothetical protein [Spirochaetaceae bacterium]